VSSVLGSAESALTISPSESLLYTSSNIMVRVNRSLIGAGAVATSVHLVVVVAVEVEVEEEPSVQVGLFRGGDYYVVPVL